MKQNKQENIPSSFTSKKMESPNEDYDKEEWGAWKIVSDMLDKPDEFGIYQTSECYRKLYEFVCEQKRKAIEQAKSEAIKEAKELGYDEGSAETTMVCNSYSIPYAVAEKVKEIKEKIDEISWKKIGIDCDCNMCYAHEKALQDILSKLGE